MRVFWIVTLLFIIGVGIFLSCELDHGIAPLPGKLEVHVSFKGTPPEDTQGVYLVVAPQFPPHAINELFQSPNSLPLNQDTVVAEIDLPYGDYEAFGLWWYSKDTRSNLADILAMPFSGATGEPIGVSLTPENPTAIRFAYPDWNNMNRDAEIRGTVHFLGDFPDNTDVTAVAAFQFQPKTALQYLVWMRSIDFSIKPGVASHEYVLPVRHGFIQYIAVFWLEENTSLTKVKIVGEYHDPEKPDKITPILVPQDGSIDNIDVSVDWNNVRSALSEDE